MDNLRMNTFSTLLLLLLNIYKVWSLEEPRQEIYLQPRNFNPHPYSVGSSRQIAPERGPILFPPSPPPETQGSNFIRIGNIKNTEHPVDLHPYPKLVRKHKYRNPGRHQEFDNQVSPQISKALAGHAKKVLGHSKFDDPEALSSNEQKNYAFSYKVVDHLTGDDFSHTQSQDEKATSGEYRVKLPDGRVQIVSYTADKNGYKADVKYEEDMKAPQHRGNALDKEYKDARRDFYRNEQLNEVPNVKYKYGLRSIVYPATPSTPIHENNIDDYHYDSRNEKSVYAPTHTPPGQLFYPAPQPIHHNQQTLSAQQGNQQNDALYGNILQTNYQQVQQHVPHQIHIIPHHKVQIVNQGAEVLSSTVAPSYLENSGILLSTPSPQFSNDYQHVLVKSLHGNYGRK